MKKINIVKEKKDFDRAFKKREQLSSKFSYIYIYDNDIHRFGICVSKKIGKAVVRNKIKRRVKDIIDKSGLQFSNKDYIIVLKKNVVEASYNELRDDLVNLLEKLI